jgi:hypothetical protein
VPTDNDAAFTFTNEGVVDASGRRLSLAELKAAAEADHA